MSLCCLLMSYMTLWASRGGKGREGDIFSGGGGGTKGVKYQLCCFHHLYGPKRSWMESNATIIPPRWRWHLNAAKNSCWKLILKTCILPHSCSDRPLLQQNYLQQDVHVNVMLRHNLPNVPFDSSHQQKHLLVVDGLGGDDPVYRFP